MLGFLPDSGNEVPVSETDALIMRGMLKVYLDDLPGAIADLGIAAARLRTGLPATYPVPCLSHLSDAHFRRGDWDAAVTHAQLAISLAQDADRPLDLARAHARAAQVLAFRGEWSSAQAHVSAARAAAERFPQVLPVAHAAMAAISLASARGDPSGVLAATEPVRATGLLGVGGCPGIFNWRAMEAAALIGLGRLDDAESRTRRVRGGHPPQRIGIGGSGARPLSRNSCCGERKCDSGRRGVRPSPLDGAACPDAIRARASWPRRWPALARHRESGRRRSPN